ncbi:MAG: hypothetical protein ABI537_05615 [Casimicrobiaceae bacterium]
MGIRGEQCLTFTDPRTSNPVTVSTHTSFSEILDNLDAAFMAYGDWTADRGSIFGDWTYTTLRTQIGDLAVAYQVAGERDARIELYGGARYYNLNNGVTLHTTALGEFSANAKDSWTDAVGGVRVRAQLAPRWVGVAQADYGKGGSDHSWQAWAYVGYQFDWSSIGGRWRYLNFSRNHNQTNTDMTFSGPLIGAVAKF